MRKLRINVFKGAKHFDAICPLDKGSFDKLDATGVISPYNDRKARLRDKLAIIGVAPNSDLSLIDHRKIPAFQIGLLRDLSLRVRLIAEKFSEFYPAPISR